MPVEQTKRRNGAVVYRARFNLNHTPFKSPWYPSSAQAKEWEAQQRTGVAHGSVNTGKAVTVAALAEIWLERHVMVNKTASSGRRDRETLKRHVLPKLGHVQLKNLSTQAIDFLFSDIKRAGVLKPKTINNCLGTVKRMLNDGVRWGFLFHNPAKAVAPMKLHRAEVTTFQRDEILKLLAFTMDRYPEEHALIGFALNTGCRLGECVALTWARVDFGTCFATIDATYDDELRKVVPRTKGKRFRKVPLNDATMALLRRLAVDGRKASSPYVFHRIKYKYFSTEKFGEILRQAGLEDALARKATFHCTRHTFASEFMRSGGSLYDLQHVLGHASVTQTEKYAHFAPSFLAGATQRVSFAAPGGDVVVLRKQGT